MLRLLVSSRKRQVATVSDLSSATPAQPYSIPIVWPTPTLGLTRSCRSAMRRFLSCPARQLWGQLVEVASSLLCLPARVAHRVTRRCEIVSKGSGLSLSVAAYTRAVFGHGPSASECETDWLTPPAVSYRMSLVSSPLPLPVAPTSGVGPGLRLHVSSLNKDQLTRP